MNLWERLLAQLRRAHQTRPKTPYQVINRTRQTVLASRLTLANTAETRKKGLLGRNSLPPGEGLWIIPCQAIHMFFMRFPIDLVYIDSRKRVRKVRSAVAPWRLSGCLSAHSVLELPAGVVRDTQTQRGDTLEISPIVQTAPQASQEAVTVQQNLIV